ncbi:MAG: calcium/sodium antiporter [Deltaproteobacteria bacterium]|nr:calcium/sodium antiporter [Deltaproteobacteria bacterium]MBW1793343.1 calcium/sodium antiporter [Deltaproteobacteria bacterium]MBW2329935.1 calcium/sodium antiporter [Deltaproteobacteria bacterium]
MSILLDVVLIAISTGLLWKGSHWLVDSAVRIAHKLHMSDLAIGLTIVAMGTSAPEFAVTINAAIRGLPDISVSNIVGSNIFNLGFILGGCAVIRNIQTTPALVWRDGLFLLGTSSILVLFLKDLVLTSQEALALFAALVVYIGYLFWKKVPIEEKKPEENATWKDIPFFVLGIIAVVAGGHLIVWSAVSLAQAFSISQWVIGVTIIAAGTSTPEFAISLVAALKGRYGISAGNLIGSDLYNLLGVLGLAGMLRPLTIDAAGLESLYILVGMVLLVVVFMRTGFRVSRAEGCLLVGLNLIRWILDFSAQG